jgi:ribonucleoside-diphosphate reductase beta chain
MAPKSKQSKNTKIIKKLRHTNKQLLITIEELKNEVKVLNGIILEINAEIKETVNIIKEEKINVTSEEKINVTTENTILIDPIFDPANKRESLEPIVYKDVWDMYKKAVAAFWIPEEIDLLEDIKDWNRLSDDERYFIKHILAFFAGSDFIVNENLKGDNFMDSITMVELEFFYRFQQTIEDVHTRAYSNLLSAYIKDEKELFKLRNAVKTIPAIAKKAEWARKWIKNGTIIERIVAFAIVEGIFFSGSFCAIFWLKKRGLMPGLTYANELISRDEGMHRDMACIIYQKYVHNKLPVETVIKMVMEAVAIEKEFICDSLPVNLIGMGNKSMSQYIEYVADHLTYNLINIQIYNCENPFEWMNLISVVSKTNFFEKRVAEYAKQTMLSRNEADNEIAFDAEI